MQSKTRIGGLLILAVMLVMTTGCRYLTNRYYDFRDTFALGVGVTAENPFTGIIPPSLGVYAEVTDWLQLGAITHNGYTAESDLRGSFAGPESYTRFGFLWCHVGCSSSSAILTTRGPLSSTAGCGMQPRRTSCSILI